MTYVAMRSDRKRISDLPDKIISDAVREMAYAKGHFLFEENFNALVQSFIDIEHRSLSVALNNIVRRNAIAEDPHQQIAEFNAHMYALMFSAKAYVDKTRKWLVAEFGAESFELERFDEGRRNEHAASFSFKLLETLRNHAQHSGTAIAGLITPQTKTPTERVTSCSPTVSRDVLLMDPEFAKIADELRTKPPSYPILPAIRCYMACMGRVHEELRTILRPRLTVSRGAVLLPLFRAEVEDGVLFVTETDASGTKLGEHSIWATILHRIERLETRNKYADYSTLSVQMFRDEP